MPTFPEIQSVWPPVQFEPVFDKLQEHNAWLSDDVGALQRIYGTVHRETNSLHVHDAALYRGGLKGTIGGMLQRGWYGKPVTSSLGSQKTILHAPLAAEVCSLSADSLYGRPTSFTVEGQDDRDTPTPLQKRLDYIANGADPQRRLHEAAETSAGLGGTYWKLDYDRAFDDHVRITWVDADSAFPTHRGGRLTAVTFWSAHVVGDNVYRHLEVHEAGTISHRVFLGEQDNLGFGVPLANAADLIPALEYLTAPEEDAVLVDEYQRTLLTGMQRLTAGYGANTLKNPVFRQYAHLSWVGKSDLLGLEPFLQAYDQTWSSWIRDIAVGRARIFVGEGLLETGGLGRGAIFDDDRDVFRQVRSLASADGKEIDAQQFEIRAAEHEATLNALAKQIMRRAGHGVAYLDGNGRQITATEVDSNDSREDSARDRRIRYGQARDTEAVSAQLEWDGIVFPGAGGMPGVKVLEKFAEDVQVDLDRESRIIGQLRTAGAISRALMVKRANPDMTKKELNDEVKRIEAEEKDRRASEGFGGAAGRFPGDPAEDSADPADDDE
jgi:hypothetical protein